MYVHYLRHDREDEHAVPASTLLKRNSQALVILVGHVLHISPSSPSPLVGAAGMGDLVSALISLATFAVGSPGAEKVGDITQAAEAALNHALGVMSATDFAAAVALMLKSSEPSVSRFLAISYVPRSHNIMRGTDSDGCAGPTRKTSWKHFRGRSPPNHTQHD